VAGIAVEQGSQPEREGRSAKWQTPDLEMSVELERGEQMIVYSKDVRE